MSREPVVLKWHPPSTPHRATPAAPTALKLLDRLFEGARSRPRVTLWDGTHLWPPIGGNPPYRYEIVFKEPRALQAIAHGHPELKLAEAFIAGDIEVYGDLEQCVATIWPFLERSGRSRWAWLQHVDGAAAFCRRFLPRPAHSRDRDREAVSYHYDQPRDFYELWLDDGMVYSCAYFAHDAEDLQRAQVRKLDYLCRKLRLHRGERLLDIGCGWGALILHAARNYGVEAVGITLSASQAAEAQARIRKSDVARTCAVRLCDYRDLDGAGFFDKIVSVGMAEHVGQGQLPDYFGRVYELLKPGGVFLLHGIARSALTPRPAPGTFIDKYVFPDGELVPVHTLIESAESRGFEVRDVENLRGHYALTLREWVRRLQSQHDEIAQVAGERTYRIWRLYMAASAHAFQAGTLGLYQTLLLKMSAEEDLPLTRSDWYTHAGPGRFPPAGCPA